MQNIMIGLCVFLFSASIAITAYSASLLGRSIEILRYMLHVLDEKKGQEEILRKEGTD